MPNYQIQQKQADGSLLELEVKTNAELVRETESKKVLTKAEREKLAGIETGAQANKIEVVKVNGNALPIEPSDKSVDVVIESDKYIEKTEKGVKNGVATLDKDGLIPNSQLPSYVDDVLEFDTYSDFPPKGESGKIYIDKSTNLQYRWGGTEYAIVSQSLALGETPQTAYAGDKGKKNADDIASLKQEVSDLTSTTNSNSEELQGIIDGTTKIPSAESADKLSTARNVELTGDITGTTTFDGSKDATIDTTLKNVGTAGTYSVVKTDAKGRVIEGGQVLEVATSADQEPSENLAVGGLFFKYLGESL